MVHHRFGFGLLALGFGLWAVGCGLWAVGLGLCMTPSAAIHVIGTHGRTIPTVVVFTRHLGVIVTVLATTLAERRRVNTRDSK